MALKDQVPILLTIERFEGRPHACMTNEGALTEPGEYNWKVEHKYTADKAVSRSLVD